MRIAFYAPLKPPSHPIPSGDRRIARLLLRALRQAGHEVRVVSRFRSYEGAGNCRRQALLRRRGEAVAARLLAGPLQAWRPDLWFTYHLYQKAPDWLGPTASRALAIPYLVAEAAYAPRRSRGRWDEGLAAVAAALQQADAAILLNPNDAECVVPLLASDARAKAIPPFLPVGPYRRAWRRRAAHRAELARSQGLPIEVPWLLAVGMMRAGDKRESYRVLARALSGLAGQPWRLLVAGDGPAAPEVREDFRAIHDRVHWVGALPERNLVPLYAACDLFVWPAVNEAIGMAILEAQAAGLPAVVGDAGAVSTIVADGKTGHVVPAGQAEALRAAVGQLLSDPAQRAAMSAAALGKTAAEHDLSAAAARLDAVLRWAVEPRGKRALP